VLVGLKIIIITINKRANRYKVVTSEALMGPGSVLVSRKKEKAWERGMSLA